MPTKEQIIEAISDVYDPHIPINIVDLGFIYGVDIEDGDVRVTMTLTNRACPVQQSIVGQVEQAVKSVDGVEKAEVELTFEPLWSVDRISEEAKEKLRTKGYDI